MDNFEPSENEEYECEVVSGEESPRRRLPFWLGIVTGVFIACLVVCGAFLFRSLFQEKNTTTYLSSESLEKLETILGLLDTEYIEDLDEKTITDALAKGLLSGIGDDYAAYYTTEEYEEFQESFSGEYAGLGALVTWDSDALGARIVKTYDDSPAEKSGLVADDIITKADGETFENLDLMVAAIKGGEGTQVELTVLRDGEEFTVTITREIVEEEMVIYEMLESNIGYIIVSQFATVAEQQFYDAVEDLRGQGMTSLIIDIRGNLGGNYDTVVGMSDRILGDAVILTVEYKNGTVVTERSDEETKLDIPIVVLVNGMSASASEVFAGALQDNDAATIVGTQTYGKGVVQNVYRLSDGSGVKFTTSRYYTPSGVCIDGIGITPDVVVELPEDSQEDTQLQKAIEILTN